MPGVKKRRRVSSPSPGDTETLRTRRDDSGAEASVDSLRARRGVARRLTRPPRRDGVGGGGGLLIRANGTVAFLSPAERRRAAGAAERVGHGGRHISRLLPTLLSALMLIDVSGCGSGGSSSATTGSLNLRALWEQQSASSDAAEAVGSRSQTEPSGGFGPKLPAAVKTVRFLFASDAGLRCCVAVDPYLACVDQSCTQRVIVIDDLPAGPGTLQISAFATDFAPTVADVTQTCGIEPGTAGRPCGASGLATPSFDSGPRPVTINAGTETDAGDIPIPAVPFTLTQTLRPLPNSVVASPVPIAFTVVDAVTGIDGQSIGISLKQGSAAARRVPPTLTPCNDAGDLPCSDGGELQVTGFRVATDPELLDGARADVSIVARNRAPTPRILAFTYGFAVESPPTVAPTRTPTQPGAVTPSRQPTVTPTPISMATPTSTGSPVAGPISFVRVDSHVVSPQPEFFAIADFNRDGLDDVAVSSPNSKEVNLLLGNADGSFAPGTVLSLDDPPGWIAAGRLNSDDSPDLTVADQRGAAVFVLLNRHDGTGTFSPPSKRSVGFSPFAVAIANFDGQNGDDLALSDRAGSQVAILLNAGGSPPSFRDGGNHSVGTGPEDLVVADFDGDGDLDIASLNNGDQAKSVTLLLFDGITSGVPSFRRSGDFTVGERPSKLTLGNFNNDGPKDLAMLNRPLDGDRGEVEVLLGQSDGRLQHGETLRLLCPSGAGEAGCRPRALAAGDFDLDGSDDLAVTQSDPAETETDALRIFAGTGDGNFELGNVFRTDRLPNAMAAGDISGDGLPDLAIGSDETSTVQAYVNATTP